MKKVIKELQEKLNNNKFILGCSTGPDSMALFNLCLDEKVKNNMIVCHVNHKVRQESDIEEEYIKNLCDSLGIKIYIKHLENIQTNFEEVARNKRYEFFKEVAKQENAKYILTAHNADDQVETVIMRLIKSSSLKGYAGILKEQSIGDFVLYRPLLEATKNEILEYDEQNQVKYFIDETNFQNIHMRNRIRKDIVPILLKENANLYSSISYYSMAIQAADTLLEQEIQDFIKANVSYIDDYLTFKVNSLNKYDEYISKSIIFRLLKHYELSIYQIDEIYNAIVSDNPKIINHIKDDLTFIKEYGNVYFILNFFEELEYNLEINDNGVYNLPNGYQMIVDNSLCFIENNCEKLCYNINIPFIVRNRRDGDRITRVSKTKVYKQKINNLLTTKKVSSIFKSKLLLIEKDGEVKQIIGLNIK